MTQINLRSAQRTLQDRQHIPIREQLHRSPIALAVFELVVVDAHRVVDGAGEVFGERQAGWTDLKLGRLPQDESIVFEARGVKILVWFEPERVRPDTSARAGGRCTWPARRGTSWYV